MSRKSNKNTDTALFTADEIEEIITNVEGIFNSTEVDNIREKLFNILTKLKSLKEDLVNESNKRNTVKQMRDFITKRYTELKPKEIQTKNQMIKIYNHHLTQLYAEVYLWIMKTREFLTDQIIDYHIYFGDDTNNIKLLDLNDYELLRVLTGSVSEIKIVTSKLLEQIRQERLEGKQLVQKNGVLSNEVKQRIIDSQKISDSQGAQFSKYYNLALQSGHLEKRRNSTYYVELPFKKYKKEKGKEKEEVSFNFGHVAEGFDTAFSEAQRDEKLFTLNDFAIKIERDNVKAAQGGDNSTYMFHHYSVKASMKDSGASLQLTSTIMLNLDRLIKLLNTNTEELKKREVLKELYFKEKKYEDLKNGAELMNSQIDKALNIVLNDFNKKT